MQVAGVACGICREEVAFARDATWCARCLTVLHLACLSATLNHCPTCRQIYDPPEQYFVYSELCPECSTPNNPAQADCVHCRARTRWDTAAAYDEFRDHMRSTSRWYMIRGIAGLAGSLICLLVFLVILFGEIAVMRLGMFVALAVLLFKDGLTSIFKSREIGRFK